MYLIKAHLVRLLGRKRQEAGWLQRRIFHFQRKKGKVTEIMQFVGTGCPKMNHSLTSALILHARI